MWLTYHWKPLQYSTVIISASYPSIQYTCFYIDDSNLVMPSMVLVLRSPTGRRRYIHFPFAACTSWPSLCEPTLTGHLVPDAFDTLPWSKNIPARAGSPVIKG